MEELEFSWNKFIEGVSHIRRVEEMHPGTDRESPGVHCSIQTLGDAMFGAYSH